MSAVTGRANGHTRPIRVVILDDVTHVRRGLEVLFRDEEGIDVVGSCAEPDSIVELAKTHNADVALVDLKIHDDFQAGIDAILRLKRVLPRIKCLVITAFPSTRNFVRSLRAHADGFIRKDSMADDFDLAQLVRSAVRGHKHFDGQMVEKMPYFVDDTRLVNDDSEPDLYEIESSLTGREIEILQAIAEGLTNDEIASKYSISVNTVKAHVRQILRKLDAKSRHEAVRVARQRNLID